MNMSKHLFVALVTVIGTSASLGLADPPRPPLPSNSVQGKELKPGGTERGGVKPEFSLPQQRAFACGLDPSGVHRGMWTSMSCQADVVVTVRALPAPTTSQLIEKRYYEYTAEFSNIRAYVDRGGACDLNAATALLGSMQGTLQCSGDRKVRFDIVRNLQMPDARYGNRMRDVSLAIRGWFGRNERGPQPDHENRFGGSFRVCHRGAVEYRQDGAILCRPGTNIDNGNIDGSRS